MKKSELNKKLEHLTDLAKRYTAEYVYEATSEGLILDEWCELDEDEQEQFIRIVAILGDAIDDLKKEKS